LALKPIPSGEVGQAPGQMRDGAGHDVPLAQVATPQDPGYWRAAEDLGFGQLALLLPTRPLDESFRLLDDYTAAVEQYRR
jgi:hypothetical protein